MYILPLPFQQYRCHSLLWPVALVRPLSTVLTPVRIFLPNAPLLAWLPPLPAFTSCLVTQLVAILPLPPGSPFNILHSEAEVAGKSAWPVPIMFLLLVSGLHTAIHKMTIPGWVLESKLIAKAVWRYSMLILFISVCRVKAWTPMARTRNILDGRTHSFILIVWFVTFGRFCCLSWKWGETRKQK